ncbi:MAG: hypothetical protein RLN60_02385 [Phycisphaerales bacterium]
MIITWRRGGQFTQIVTHEVHALLQAKNMLRRMGVILVEIDSNAMEFPRREA